MRATIPFLGALVLLALAPAQASAIVPCVKEHVLRNEFVDEETGNKGRVAHRVVATEIVAGEPRHEAEGALLLLDVVSGKELGIQWEAVADSVKLAHASYLAAVESVLLKTGGSATGITLQSVRLRGDAEFTDDEVLRVLSLVAGSYALSGGADYVGVLLDVAEELGLTLPDLLARPR